MNQVVRTFPHRTPDGPHHISPITRVVILEDGVRESDLDQIVQDLTASDSSPTPLRLLVFRKRDEEEEGGMLHYQAELFNQTSRLGGLFLCMGLTFSLDNRITHAYDDVFAVMPQEEEPDPPPPIEIEENR